MVHPVIVGVELVVDLAVGGELARDRIPEEATALVDVGAAAERVEEGPVVVAFVAVVGAVHAGPLVAPDEGAVLARVAFLVDGRGLVHDVDELALAQRPVG